MPKFITIGLMARFVPVIDSRVITWTTWERDRSNLKGSAFRPFVDVGDELRERWRRILERPTCVTGYPDVMDALEVVEKAERWADEAVFDLGELLVCEVRQMWYPTKDNVAMCGTPSRWDGAHGDSSHPFHFDNQVLKHDTEEGALEEARIWFKYFTEESARMNKSYNSKTEMKWETTATDSRICK